MATTTQGTGRSGAVLGIVSNSVYRIPIDFADDASPGTFTDTTISTGDVSGGMIVRVAVVFGETAPNTLTVTIKDSDGVTLITETVTATGNLYIESPIAFKGDLTLSLSGNTTASATGKVVLYLI